MKFSTPAIPSCLTRLALSSHTPAQKRALRRALVKIALVALPALLLTLTATRNLVATAQNTPGALDPAFGNGGRVVTPFPNGRDNAEDVAVQADGKVVVAGSSGSDFALARYNTDGTLDETFGTGGRVHTDFPLDQGGFASALVIQPDGKIVLAGEATDATQSFSSGFALARYNADGSLDTSFDTDGLVITSFPGGSASAADLLLQPDGKLVAAGTRQDNQTFDSVFALARYNTDGSLDTSFDSDGRATIDIADTTVENGHGAALQADGRIVVVGNGSSVFAVARVNSNGSPDNTFDTDGQVFTNFRESFEQANAVAVQTDGRIVVVGEVATSLGEDDNFAVARYNTDGSPDNTFDGDGKVTTDFGLVDSAKDVSIHPDGRIIAAGRAGTFASGTFFALARYHTNGAPDTSFDGNGQVLTDVSGGRFNLGGRGIALYTEGRIIVAGGENSSGQLDFGVVRYNSNGSPDTTFDGDGKAVTDFPLNEETITDMAVQPDGKIVAVGRMNPRFIIRDTQDFNILLARYNPDGSLDTSFGSGGLVSTDFNGNGDDLANAVVLQPDGKIVVAGQTGANFSFIALADTSFGVARYNPNGTLDETFGTGGKATVDFGSGHERAYDVALQSDGKIVLVGSTPFEFKLARLNPDGSLDSGAAGDTTPGDMFGTNGKVTTDFSSAQPEGANAVLIQPDGKIVAAGHASTDFAIARYNADGSLDTTFDTDGKVTTEFPGGGDSIFGLVRQADGKLVAAGTTTTTSTTINDHNFALARYNADGSPDTTFDTDGKVTTDFGGFDLGNDIALQADGRIVVVGLHFPFSAAVGDAGIPSRLRADEKVYESPAEAAKFRERAARTAAPGAQAARAAAPDPIGVFAVARYDANGSLDNSFDGDGRVTTDFFGVDNEAFAVVIGANGRIVAGGYTDNGSSRDFALARYLAPPSATPTPTPPTCALTTTYSVSPATFTLGGDQFNLAGVTDRSITLTTAEPVLGAYIGSITIVPGSATTPSGEYGMIVSQTITFAGGATATLSRRFVYTVTPSSRIISLDSGETKTADLGAQGTIDITLKTLSQIGNASNNNAASLTIPARGDDAAFQLRNAPGGSSCPTPSPTPTPTPISASIVEFDSSAYLTNEGAGKVVVTIRRTGNAAAPASIDYATRPDREVLGCDAPRYASERCDFTTTLGTMRFAAGETSKSFPVFLTDDSYMDGDETFELSLSNPSSGVTLGTIRFTTVILVDNDTVANAPNPIDNSTFFVKMHYIDFLNREGEPAGVAGWVSSLNTCPLPSDPFAPSSCDRVEVSSRFFRSEEFMLKGNFVIRFYRVSLGRNPGYRDFTRDSQRVTGETAAEVFANRDAFTNEWVERADFRAAYDGLSNQAYVDKLEQTAGVALSNKAQLVADLDASRKTRAQVLREIVESNEVRTKMFPDAFVLMEYFGYLRRDAEPAGFNAWLAYLNAHPGDYRTMVRGFVNSVEYRKRFGNPGAPQPGQF